MKRAEAPSMLVRFIEPGANWVPQGLRCQRLPGGTVTTLPMPDGRCEAVWLAIGGS